MSVSYWLDRPQSEKTKIPQKDVVIVGAGIAGLSLAYWLKKKAPKLSVAVFDQGRFAGQASGRNAGFVTCGSIVHFQKMRAQFGFEKALQIWRISERNHNLLREELIKPTNSASRFDYALTGSCTVAPNAEQFEAYEQAVRELQIHGVEFATVSPKSIESEFGIEALSGGALYARDGFVHPVKLLTALCEHLVKMGSIEIFEHAPISRFEPTGRADEGWSFETPAHIGRAKRLVFATNAFTRSLIPSLWDHVVPGRGQIIVTEPTEQFIRGPCYYTPNLTYFRQLPTGEVLLGGFRNLAASEETTLADETTETIQNALDQFLRKHLPKAKELKVKHRWSGPMAFTKDGQPLVGELPGAKNLFLQVGCSGHGMGLGFVLGEILSDHLVNGVPTPEPFQPFRLTERPSARVP